MGFWVQGITQKNYKVNLIMFNLGSHLLFPTQMPCQIFMNI